MTVMIRFCDGVESPVEQRRKRSSERQGPQRAAGGSTVDSFLDRRVRVVPRPPQKRRADQIVRRIKQSRPRASDAGQAHAAGPGGIKLARRNQGACRDRGVVHEADVDARNVEGQSRSEHDHRLGLPEVVDERKRHEEDVVCGPSDQRSDENKTVLSRRRVVEERVREAENRDHDEEELA